VPESEQFDLAVIGAGPGGVAAAVEGARRGARVLLIERDQPGGTCLNWGCIPTKILLATAELRHRALEAAEVGLTLGEVGLDWSALRARVEKIVQRLIQGHLQEFKREKVIYRQATARLTAPGRVRLTSATGETEEIAARRIILATGSRPGSLPGIEPDGERILNSDHALVMATLPRSILIIGGGVIGCEFASLFSDLGVRVTIVEALSSLLELTGADVDVTRELQRIFKKRKIAMHFGATVERLEVSDGGVTAHLSGGATLSAERALLSIGRRLNTEGLGLEEIGLALGAKGEIPVDEHLATTLPGVYAIGDMTGQPQLAHLATHHGIIAARHALGETAVRLHAEATPWVVFTRPCLAAVGMSETAAKAGGHDVATGVCQMRTLGKAHVLGEIDGLVKLVADRPTGCLLGAHLLGARAEDLVAEVALAVRHRLTLREIADTIHPHPTMSEAIWAAATAALA
jgi:dihydrolipoamide dehydrogenase